MNRFFQFVRDSKRELMEKTTWPTREAVLNSTIVVIISIIVLSMGLFLIDVVSNWSVRFIVVEEVGQFKKLLEWLLEPALGVPWKFLSLLFLFVAIPIFIGRIVRNRI